MNTETDGAFFFRNLAAPGILSIRSAGGEAAFTVTGAMTALRSNGHSAIRVTNGNRAQASRHEDLALEAPELCT
jgi:hypothetical protein